MCNIKQAVDQWEPGRPPGVFRLLEQPPLFVFPLWLQQTCEYGGHNTFLCEEDGPWVTKELKAIMKKEKWVWHNYEYKIEEKFSYIKLLSAWRGLKRMAVVISTIKSHSDHLLAASHHLSQTTSTSSTPDLKPMTPPSWMEPQSWRPPITLDVVRLFLKGLLEC